MRGRGHQEIPDRAAIATPPVLSTNSDPNAIHSALSAIFPLGNPFIFISSHFTTLCSRAQVFGFTFGYTMKRGPTKVYRFLIRDRYERSVMRMICNIDENTLRTRWR
jgi:hypothetical protein